jgi:sulfite exporter TauE/SafE
MLTAFLIGLFSALHCFGMCGGIVGALTMSLHPDIRTRQDQLLLYNLAYNLGRILSYMVAGLVVGLLGETLAPLLAVEDGISFLRLFAAFLILALGLHIGGWYPRLALIERLGQPIWRRLEPLGKRLIPVQNLIQAFLFGIVWGWLPCGLVYFALLLAFSQGSISGAALFMLAFGAGTLLPVFSAGLLAGRLTDLRKSLIIRRVMGSMMILMGIIALWLALDPDIHHSLHYHGQN